MIMNFQEHVRQAHIKRDDYLDAQNAVNELAYELATTHFEIMTDCAETLEQLTAQHMIAGIPSMRNFYGNNEAIATITQFLAMSYPNYENFTLGEIVEAVGTFMEDTLTAKVREQFDVVVRHRAQILRVCRENLEKELAADEAAA